MMKHSCFFSQSLGLILVAGVLLGGCGDKLLPPAENNQAGGNKITLSGDLVLETPLPADAKVVLLWEIAWSSSPDYLYVYGEGTIDREKNTFEITLNDKPAFEAVNWVSPAYDTAFGVGIIAVVSGDVQQGVFTYSELSEVDKVYGLVNKTELVYFSPNSFSWGERPFKCDSWTTQFKQGYQVGLGVEPPDSDCLHDGFKPVPPEGLKLIINTDPSRFSFVNWT